MPFGVVWVVSSGRRFCVAWSSFGGRGIEATIGPNQDDYQNHSGVSCAPKGVAPRLPAVRYHAYLSKANSLVVVELDLDATFKLGDLFTLRTGTYEVTDVKPGYGDFDAIIFADLADRQSE